jgi:hypothetical protein
MSRELNIKQAIEVKYLKATSNRGSRFKALYYNKSVTILEDLTVSRNKNAENAAKLLIEKFKLDNKIVAAGVSRNLWIFILN